MRTIHRIWQNGRGLILSLVCFVCIVCLIVVALNTAGERNASRQIAQLRQSVIKAAVACYATEGFYPEEISYLQEHYGLSWNSDRYLILYDSFSSNILPDISVYAKGAEE